MTRFRELQSWPNTGCNCRRSSEDGRRHTCSQKPSDTSTPIPSHLSDLREISSAESKEIAWMLVQRQTKSKIFDKDRNISCRATSAISDSHGLVTVIDFILFCFEFFFFFTFLCFVHVVWYNWWGLGIIHCGDDTFLCSFVLYTTNLIISSTTCR